METFSDEIMGELLEDNLETASFDGTSWSNPKHGGGSVDGRFVRWQTIEDQPKSVLADVQHIRSHPLVPRSVAIYGFIFDVATGRLNEVNEASAAGRSSA